MIFGLAPAIQSSKPDIVPILKNEIVPAGTAHRGLRGFFALRQMLVVTQIALSLVSLVAAGVFLRSLTRAERTDTGFETRGVLVMNFNLGREGYTPARADLLRAGGDAGRGAAGRQTRRDRAERAARRWAPAQRLSGGPVTRRPATASWCR